MIDNELSGNLWSVPSTAFDGANKDFCLYNLTAC